MTTAPRISLVIPVRNEHENIGTCLGRLWDALREVDHEILICYDSDEDTTLAAIAATRNKSPNIRLIKNELGRGPSTAMRAGMQAAAGDVIVVTMADLSDPPEAIPVMADKIRRGADIVSGSRYMRGGRQIDGPPVKTLLSRLAGLSLYWVAGVGTHDATTSFRAFSRRLLQTIRIESTIGFTLGLEATVKAHLRGLIVSEVPVTWTDRSAGQSNFRVAKWLGAYLRWYGRAMAVPLMIWAAYALLGVLRLASAGQPYVPTPVALAASFATVLLARKLRRRMSVLDLIPVVAWLLPGSPGFTLEVPGWRYALGAFASALTILSTRGARKR